jgi:hypothetical protein
MFYKRIFVSAVILLVFGYIAFRIIEEQHHQLPCEDSCVRFCCDAGKEQDCNFSVTSMNESSALNKNYKPISGVECEYEDYYPKEGWTFLEV